MSTSTIAAAAPAASTTDTTYLEKPAGVFAKGDIVENLNRSGDDEVFDQFGRVVNVEQDRQGNTWVEVMFGRLTVETLPRFLAHAPKDSVIDRKGSVR